VQLGRIQKERDQFSDELETLKERSESAQTLLMKAARDREAMQTDLEVLKERYEKSHAIQQKLQVIDNPTPHRTQILQVHPSSWRKRKPKTIGYHPTPTKLYTKIHCLYCIYCLKTA